MATNTATLTGLVVTDAAGNHSETAPIAVVIDDGNGYRSIYAHFREVSVKVGQRVRARVGQSRRLRPRRSHS